MFYTRMGTGREDDFGELWRKRRGREGKLQPPPTPLYRPPVARRPSTMPTPRTWPSAPSASVSTMVKPGVGVGVGGGVGCGWCDEGLETGMAAREVLHGQQQQ